MLAADEQQQLDLLDELARTMLDDRLWAERAARLEDDPLIGPCDDVTSIGGLAGYFENKKVTLPAAW